MSYSAIVASLHRRTGKTLLARALTEYFILSDQSPIVFDTDATELALASCFPRRSLVIDVSQVYGQMTLFDGLVQPSRDSRVVDVTHQSFRKFFDLMRETDFVVEARQSGIEPVIFYIADRNRDSLDVGRQLLTRFSDCAIVVVDNAYLRQAPRATRYSSSYFALEAHDLHLRMPALDPTAASFVEDSTMSLAEFLRAPLPQSCASGDTGDLALNAHAAIRAWMVRLFREFHRVTQALEARLAPEPIPLLVPSLSRSSADW